MIRQGFNSLWPTNLYFGTIDDSSLLEGVCQDILLNVDFYCPPQNFQSFDILKDGPPNLQIFRDKIVIPAFKTYLKNEGIDLDQFSNIRLRSWLTGGKNNSMIPVHNHNGASLSAVFYLLAEDIKEGGELVLMDPRSNANRGYLDEFKPLFENKVFSPTSGTFVVFPSFVYHHTIPYRGNLRLAMPVDLFL